MSLFALANVALSNHLVAPSTQLRCSVNVASGEVAVSTAAAASSSTIQNSLLTASSRSLVKEKLELPFSTSKATRNNSLAECFDRLESWRPSGRAATAFLEIDAEAVFMPMSACENIAALQMMINNDNTDCGLRAASCELMSTSGRSQGHSTIPPCSQSRVLLAVEKALDGCQARVISDNNDSNGARNAQFQSMRFKSVPAPAPAHSFSVGWRRQELASAEISTPTRWLLLSYSENVNELQSICVPAVGDRLKALNVRFCHEQQEKIMPTSTMEMIASSPAHLHWLLKSSNPDQLLLLQTDSNGTQTENTAKEREKDFYLDSLVWGHTARDLAGQRAKVSSITFSSENESTSSKIVSAVSKTRFMEDRPSHGISLNYVQNNDSNSSTLLPSAKQLNWLLTRSGETCAALKQGDLYVERLSINHSSAKPHRGLKLKPSMCCVVTGGTKGLGLHCAKQLAHEGCKHLVLTSRSGTLGSEDAAEFAALGTSVIVKSCDASSEEDCVVLARWLRENMPAIQVFAHAAGVISFDLLPDMTQEVFESSVLPKVVGAQALAAAGIPVEATLLFSSTAAVWSQAGAAHYSAGNSCLDAAACNWQNSGLPGTAVNFGPFGGDGGMASSLG